MNQIGDFDTSLPVGDFENEYGCEFTADSLDWSDRANDSPVIWRWLRSMYRDSDAVYALTTRANPALQLNEEKHHGRHDSDRFSPRGIIFSPISRHWTIRGG